MSFLGQGRDRLYRPELDSLRFFAFLAVYVNHTLIYDPTHGPIWKRLLGGIGTVGAFGVDLFFVLSAYLITDLLLRETERTGFHLLLDKRRHFR